MKHRSSLRRSYMKLKELMKKRYASCSDVTYDELNKRSNFGYIQRLFESNHLAYASISLSSYSLSAVNINILKRIDPMKRCGTSGSMVMCFSSLDFLVCRCAPCMADKIMRLTTDEPSSRWNGITTFRRLLGISLRADRSL